LKKFFKWVLIVFAILIAIGVGASMSGDDSAEPTSSTQPTPADKKEKPKEEKKDSGKITKEEYEAIVVGDSLTGEGGMTIDEAIKKFGEPQTRTESQSGDLKIEMLDWPAEGDFGANVSITFSNGKASGKSNFGLK